MTLRIAVATICWAVAFTGTALAASFSVTFRVIDDSGQPVPGAKVQVTHDVDTEPGQSQRLASSDGLSNADGLVHLEGKTRSPGISYGAAKPGYYEVRGYGYVFKEVKWFHWEPQNPTVNVLLKRIKNPVPMYARRIMEGPKHDGPLGYDFEIGDWVAPVGKGRVADMVLVIDFRKRAERDYDWDLTVTFPHPGDGLQRFSPDPSPARFRSPYEAPQEGYVSEWKLKSWSRPDVVIQTTLQKKGGYFIRVRTELDREGKVVKALYGKIYGDFFNMTCYLNPDGTRNMEYDPQRNLLKSPDNRARRDYEVGP